MADTEGTREAELSHGQYGPHQLEQPAPARPTTWAEIRGAQSSPEVTDAKAFAGCWNNMTFCLWGRGVELLVDQVSIALTGQVRIFANLLCDVGVRYPGAFAVTAPVT